MHEFLKTQERKLGRWRFSLYVVSVVANAEVRQSALVEELRNLSQPFQPLLNDESIRLLFKRNYPHVHVVRSDGCGIGKSDQIN